MLVKDCFDLFFCFYVENRVKPGISEDVAYVIVYIYYS